MNRIWEKEPPLLSVKGLKKTFGKKTVVDDVSFDVFPGEVIAVVGENGAGKSTLMKVFRVHYTPTEGTITVDGKEYSKFDPFLSKQLGINIVYQEMTWFQAWTLWKISLSATKKPMDWES